MKGAQAACTPLTPERRCQPGAAPAAGAGRISERPSPRFHTMRSAPACPPRVPTRPHDHPTSRLSLEKRPHPLGMTDPKLKLARRGSPGPFPSSLSERLFRKQPGKGMRPGHGGWGDVQQRRLPLAGRARGCEHEAQEVWAAAGEEGLRSQWAPPPPNLPARQAPTPTTSPLPISAVKQSLCFLFKTLASGAIIGKKGSQALLSARIH